MGLQNAWTCPRCGIVLDTTDVPAGSLVVCIECGAKGKVTNSTPPEGDGERAAPDGAEKKEKTGKAEKASRRVRWTEVDPEDVVSVVPEGDAPPRKPSAADALEAESLCGEAIKMERAGLVAEAHSTARAALVLNPDSATAKELVARLEGAHVEARLKRFTEDLDVLEQQGEFAAALEIVDDVAAMDELDDDLVPLLEERRAGLLEEWLHRGDDLFASGAIAQAIDLWQELLLCSPDVDEASERLERARAKIEELGPSGLKLIEGARLSESGRFSEALVAYEEAVQLGAPSSEVDALVEEVREKLCATLLADADAALESGRLDEALQGFRRAGEQGAAPDKVADGAERTMIELARIRRAKGDLVKALALLEEALASVKARKGNTSSLEQSIAQLRSEQQKRKRARPLAVGLWAGVGLVIVVCVTAGAFYAVSESRRRRALTDSLLEEHDVSVRLLQKARALDLATIAPEWFSGHQEDVEAAGPSGSDEARLSRDELERRITKQQELQNQIESFIDEVAAPLRVSETAELSIAAGRVHDERRTESLHDRIEKLRGAVRVEDIELARTHAEAIEAELARESEPVEPQLPQPQEQPLEVPEVEYTPTKTTPTKAETFATKAPNPRPERDGPREHGGSRDEGRGSAGSGHRREYGEDL